MSAAPPSALAIDVAGLNKHFGKRHVVKDFTLQVRQGEIYGFLGPNGSGKTTTIRMLCGLLKPDSGRGSCLGFDVLRETASIKRQVGYMTQRFSLLRGPDGRAKTSTSSPVIYALPRTPGHGRADDGKSRARQARRKQLAGSLSGGWKQRLALAACMMHNAEACCCSTSRPPASIRKARREFWEQIHALTARRRSPCWSRPTTWTRRSAATASPTSPMAQLLASRHASTQVVARAPGFRPGIVTGGWPERGRGPGSPVLPAVGASIRCSALRSMSAPPMSDRAPPTPSSALMDDPSGHLARDGAEPGRRLHPPDQPKRPPERRWHEPARHPNPPPPKGGGNTRGDDPSLRTPSPSMGKGWGGG